MPADELEPFQKDAVERLRDIMRHRGGAILADSVGLGKTHVAAALIREEIANGGSVLVTAPAQLRAHWTRHLRGARRWRWTSHTSMSRCARTSPHTTLVVVDEAHAFRNPAANRYAALALACERARTLLLTATPVNNSLFDFYHLLRLFAADDLFADVGVPDLFSAVHAALRGDAMEVQRVAACVMVRRTRRIVSLSQSRLRFPASHEIEPLRCESDPAFEQCVERICDTVPLLEFPAHGASDGRTDQARELMRLGLLKRLESSPWAFDASIRRHIRLLEYFVTAARAGLAFDARRDAAHDVGGAMQLAFDRLVLPRWPPALAGDAMIDAALRDIGALRTMTLHADPKLARLRRLFDELANERVLLFTEYRDTAHGLWRSLSPGGGIAMIHGSDARLGRARSSRRAIIERFSPLSNGARTPRRAEAVRLLIATDVLSEGLNLQDARIVISYDMPWNPVRLAQRIGRIDRLGSRHEHIRAFAFTPDGCIEDVLHMMKRIRRKLRHVRMVGGDAPALRDARRARRVRAELDTAADTRERARAVLLSATAGQRTMRATAAGSGAICCFQTAAGALVPVLIEHERPPEVDSARAWTLLADLTDIRPAGTDTDRIEHAARHALRGFVRNRRRLAAADTAIRTRDAVGRWLASRTDGLDDEEARQLDRVLERLRVGRRAGTDLRLAQLLALAGEGSSISAVYDLLESAPAPAHPNAPDGAEIIAILLLERASGTAPEDVSLYAPTG